MKRYKAIILCLALSGLASGLQAQDHAIHPYIVTTHYLHMIPANRAYNLDSLLKIYKERIMDSNAYYIHPMIVSHMWGHDSRQVLFMYGLKSWDDVIKSAQRGREIMKAHKGWASDEDFKTFEKALWSYFEPEHHSDEIYNILAE